MKQLHEVLKKILTKNESLIYCTLLQNSYSASELNKLTGINRSKVYDCINRLLHLNLIREEVKTKKAKTYIANDPNLVKQIIQNQIKEKQQLLKQFNQSLPEVEKIYSFSDTSRFWIIKGTNNIVKEIRNEIKNTNKFSYIIAVRMGFFKNHKGIIQSYKQLLKKGVDIRVITNNHPTAMDVVKKIGCKALIIKDNRIGPRTLAIKEDRFAITITKNNPLRLITNNKDIIETMKSIFLTFWDLSKNSDQVKKMNF